MKTALLNNHNEQTFFHVRIADISSKILTFVVRLNIRFFHS